MSAEVVMQYARLVREESRVEHQLPSLHGVEKARAANHLKGVRNRLHRLEEKFLDPES